MLMREIRITIKREKYMLVIVPIGLSMASAAERIYSSEMKKGKYKTEVTIDAISEAKEHKRIYGIYNDKGILYNSLDLKNIRSIEMKFFENDGVDVKRYLIVKDQFKEKEFD